MAGAGHLLSYPVQHRRILSTSIEEPEDGSPEPHESPDPKPPSAQLPAADLLLPSRRRIARRRAACLLGRDLLGAKPIRAEPGTGFYDLQPRQPTSNPSDLRHPVLHERGTQPGGHCFRPPSPPWSVTRANHPDGTWPAPSSSSTRRAVSCPPLSSSSSTVSPASNCPT